MIRDVAGMKIRTDYWAKPIPIRSFDWTAVDYDTYAPSSDAPSVIGRGASEEEAIADLLDQLGAIS